MLLRGAANYSSIFLTLNTFVFFTRALIIKGDKKFYLVAISPILGLFASVFLEIIKKETEFTVVGLELQI